MIASDMHQFQRHILSEGWFSSTRGTLNWWDKSKRIGQSKILRSRGAVWVGLFPSVYAISSISWIDINIMVLRTHRRTNKSPVTPYCSPMTYVHPWRRLALNGTEPRGNTWGPIQASWRTFAPTSARSPTLKVFLSFPSSCNVISPLTTRWVVNIGWVCGGLQIVIMSTQRRSLMRIWTICPGEYVWEAPRTDFLFGCAGHEDNWNVLSIFDPLRRHVLW